jgi:CDGSH-type Zn-finger protein/truncated hemoglobin YjbI
MTSTVEYLHPIPGVVDRESALAVIDRITRVQPDRLDGPRSAAEPPGLAQISRELRNESSPVGRGLQPTRGPASRVPLTEPDSRGSVSDPNGRLPELFRQAYQALLGALGRSVSAEVDLVAARHDLRDVTTRLRQRVLRPLAEGLFQLPGNPLTLLTAEFRTEADRTPIGLPERLRSLALAATEIRADFAAVPAELAEATAGLQDLAATYAVSGDADSTAFLEQCEEALSRLPRSIQVVRNGPYLLTNIERLTNDLGEPIQVRPQMAVCRCGQSAVKPWCDGSHARVDFTGAKDPNRVADRRDSYDGLAVTVFDNRGICQHSGYCTDRIPVAFRVSQEPFVAPSGARMDEIIRAVRNCPSGALSFAIDAYENREVVDWHHQRPSEVSVTADGPYRVIGGVQLLDETGRPVHRNQGASLEHYALCRCGHSQNKPFCSGMHWYINFRDAARDSSRRPTLFEWCGGLPALTRTTRLFFERYVPEDPLLAPLFAGAPADHPERVAMWLGQVLGGPPDYERQHGSYAYFLSRHGGQTFSEDHRTRWVNLLCRSARETGLGADPEFWSAFTSYIEWESRQVLQYSQTDGQSTEEQPSPRWDWGPAGAPNRPAATATNPNMQADEAPLPSAGEPVSFDAHIKAMFRPHDRQSMAFAFDLWSYDDVRKRANAILSQLRAGTMPCDGAWPDDRIDVFQRWIAGGQAP